MNSYSFKEPKTNIIDKIMISSKISKLLELPTYSKRPKNGGYSLKNGHFQLVFGKAYSLVTAAAAASKILLASVF